MQFSLSILRLLVFTFFVSSVLANPGPQPTAAPDTVGETIDNAIDNIGSHVDNVKDAATSVWGNFEDLLPSITAIPSNVDAWFDSIEDNLENVPQSVWRDIKTGLYPPEVSQWIENLPENMQAEASQRLTEWADDVGNGSGRNTAVAVAAVGVAGVLALAMAL
ncbi:hypothetical protein BDZ91DRAFT_115751 [Kalaharituber pfeilii]|nr:hypothetical protein BDZ91DRAFT_115751 [Kalaharituber pfeilii]